jgi:hypothetical protein
VVPGRSPEAFLLGPRLGAQGVDEEDASARPERGPDEVPERLEVVWRNVREPEAEEDRVVGAIGVPVEEVGLEVADGNLGAGLL